MSEAVVPTHLFVAGCPRSGTTALTRLLNLHPDIVIGLERYKTLFSRSYEVSPALFHEDRFFDFRKDDTTFAPGSERRSEEATAFYDKARSKFPTAKFIGDKYPQFFRFYDRLFRKLPNARVIFIVRDPLYVAQSWQRRSEDSSGWPERNDARRAVQYWNDALAYTLAYTQIKKNAFVLVDYEQFFAARTDGLLELLGWIGADLAPAIKAQVIADAVPEFERSETVLAKPMDLPTNVVADVSLEADQNLYRRARKFIENQRQKMAGD